MGRDAPNILVPCFFIMLVTYSAMFNKFNIFVSTINYVFNLAPLSNTIGSLVTSVERSSRGNRLVEIEKVLSSTKTTSYTVVI